MTHTSTKNHTVKQNVPLLILPWASWFITTMFFAHQYFLQVSANALAPDFVRNFQFSPADIGALASSFFIAFIALKMVAGVLIDTYGARLMLTISSFATAIAAFSFSHFHTLFAMELSRVLMGAGTTFSYLGVLKILSTWFDNKRVATLNSITISIGILGAIIGEGPVASLANIINWEEIINLAGFFSLILTVLIFLLVKDHPPGLSHAERQNLKCSLKTVHQVLYKTLKCPTLWVIGLMAGLLAAPRFAFYSLWGAIFLHHIYQISSTDAEFIISLAFFGILIGTPLHAFIANKVGSYVKPLRFFTALSIIPLSLIIMVKMPLPIVYILIFLLGMLTSVVGLVFPLTTKLISKKIAGMATGLVASLFTIIGAVITQVIGNLLSLHWHPQVNGAMLITNPIAFKLVLLSLPLAIIGSIICASFINEHKFLH